MIVLYPNIDPVAIHIGSWGIRWYGLAYLAGFFWVWYKSFGTIKDKQLKWIGPLELETMLVNLMLGLLIGGRLGYMFFYQWPQLLADPLVLFKIWQGGMSFHGALLGGIFVAYYQAIKFKVDFFHITDLILPWAPLGLGLGRLANFINGELWGRATNSDWGMIFPLVDNQARHPSQLYEFFFEGIVLSIIMYIGHKLLTKTGKITALFLFSYGGLRFLVEFFREPDWQIGLLVNSNLSLGQLLSIPMIVLGVIFWRKFNN